MTPQSLDILVAQTQGALAYILSQAFENACARQATRATSSVW